MMWHLSGKPYSVQVEALNRAAPYLKYAYWLEMGLGKSALALNDFVTAVRDHDVLFNVVICPDSLKSNWWAEAETFGLKADIHVWPFPYFVTPQPPAMIIMNYEALLYSGGDWLDRFIKRYDGRIMLTADESTRFKNFQSRTANRMIALSPYAKVVRELTGAPMTQNVMDLWPQLRFIGQLSGINPYQFRNTYAVMGGYLGKQVIGLKNEDRLNDLLARCTFRAYKKDWTDLPPKVFPPPREVVLSKRQRELYKEMEDDLMVMLDDEAVTAPMVITCLEKLQQISSGFLIGDDGTTHDLVEPKLNPKALEIRAVCEEAGGKVLVFCRHRRAVDHLVEVLRDFNPAVMRGGMSRQEMDFEKIKFNERREHRVMIAQSSVGGMGHTLLGGSGRDRCSLTVFSENSFSLGDRMQAEDRNHRHGQDSACVTYVDVISSRVEAKITQALQKKLNWIDMLRAK